MTATANPTFYDVIVAGGGPSGLCAAISAARLGVRVLLIERYGFCGGMNTAGLVGPIMTFHAGSLQIVRGIGDELIQTLVSLKASPGHLVDPIWANTSMTPIDTDVYKAVIFEALEKAGVELLLHSQVLGATKHANGVESVQVGNKSGLTHFSARYFIDATGDGDLAATIGVPFTHGRSQDALTQPMSLMFKMNGVNVKKIRDYIREFPQDFYLGFPLETFLSFPALAVSGFFSIVKKAREQNQFNFDRDRVLFFGLPREGEVTINTLRIGKVSGIDPFDLTRAEATLRKQVPILSKFFNDFIPGFEHASVFETAPQVGVRETRHIHGDYCLRADDIFKQRKFDDVIAHASYPIDVHSPDGKGMEIIDPRKDNPESFYDVPYRCLLPVGFDNLLVTGRCISAEHQASASARISATCMALGEASGAAAALAVKNKKSSFREISMAELQAQLKRQGAFLER